MPWSIKYLKATERQLKRLDPQIRDRILRYMREHVLEVNDPYASGKALTGKWDGHWRYRVGEYRIICQILNNILVVQVVKVGHRGDVYR